MRPRARTLIIVAAVVLLVAALVAGAPSQGRPLEPDSAAPNGLLGLVELLDGADVDVEVATGAPDDTDTRLFLPRAPADAAERDAIRAWVESGGTVIVAGPAPSLHELTVASAPLTDVVGPTDREPGCAAAALEPVERIEHAAWSAFELPDQLPDEAVSCFPVADDVAWLVAQPRGEGTVIALGSPGPFVNAQLDVADNAVLAAALLAPTRGVALRVAPPPELGSGDTPLMELVPDGVWRGLLLAAVAVVVAAVWRGRRLGRPVPERLPPVLPGAELVGSVAGLLQRRGDRGDAAARVRADTRETARHALRLPETVTGSALLESVAARTGLEHDLVARALGPGDVHDDADLVEVVDACAQVRDALRTTTGMERT